MKTRAAVVVCLTVLLGSCLVELPDRIPVKSVTLSDTTAWLAPANTQPLTATVLPENASHKAVKWTSDNTAVAGVSISGVITARGLGKATITVTTEDGKKTATCTLTVSNDAPPGTR